MFNVFNEGMVYNTFRKSIAKGGGMGELRSLKD